MHRIQNDNSPFSLNNLSHLNLNELIFPFFLAIINSASFTRWIDFFKPDNRGSAACSAFSLQVTIYCFVISNTRLAIGGSSGLPNINDCCRQTRSCLLKFCFNTLMTYFQICSTSRQPKKNVEDRPFRNILNIKDFLLPP